MKSLTVGELMSNFFLFILGFGLAFLSANFFLGTEEVLEAMKEDLLKNFALRFFMWYLLGAVFVMLIVGANRILMKTEVIETYPYKRLITSGLIVMFVEIFIGTYIFFS